MKLAWWIVVSMVGVAAAESQAEIATKTNRAGVDLMTQGKYREAAEKFRDAFARVPDPQYAFNLCTASYQQGKFSEALTACHAVYPLQSSAALQAKTDQLVQKIQDDAKAQHIDVVPVAPTPPTDPHEEGVDLMYAGKYADALVKFKQSIARDLFDACTAEYQLGHFRDALDDCKAVAKHKAATELQTKTDKLIVKIRADARAQKITIE